MSYKSYALGSTYTNWGTANESPMDPNGEPRMANLGDLNPFWVGTRLLCVETLVEFSCEISCYLEFNLFWTIRAIYGLV